MLSLKIYGVRIRYKLSDCVALVFCCMGRQSSLLNCREKVNANFVLPGGRAV